MIKDPKKDQDSSMDEQWVADYKKSGDLMILGKLYQPYMPLVYGVCLKYFKDEDNSKDAVMQIFEQLITKLGNHEIKNFKSWLYVLSRNYCLMELRKSQKNTFIYVDEYFVETTPLLHHINNDEDKEAQLVALEKCIETLNHDQKLSVNLFYLQKKCYSEVAEHTGYDMNKVKSYIQNGKRNLKICLEKLND
jgi:RNA polymerase sigma-70 factor (ECF subfamily)